VIDPVKVLIVVGVGALSAALVLGIHFLIDGKWESAEALSSMVTLIATTIVVVALVEWAQRRRWRRAEKENLRATVLLSSLIASGWSSPKDLGIEDLDPASARGALRDQAAKLAESSGKLDRLYKSMLEESEVVAVFDLTKVFAPLKLYYLEGARSRRLSYLGTLVASYLPGLVERRDDPVLFAKFVALRHAVMGASAAGKHAEAAIHERVLMNRPAVLVPYLDRHPEAVAVDPVALLDRVIEVVLRGYSHRRRMARRISARIGGDTSLGDMGFIPGCLGHARNEMQWVAKSLKLLEAVLHYLEPDILSSAEEVENELLKLRIERL